MSSVIKFAALALVLPLASAQSENYLQLKGTLTGTHDGTADIVENGEYQSTSGWEEQYTTETLDGYLNGYTNGTCSYNNATVEIETSATVFTYDSASDEYEIQFDSMLDFDLSADAQHCLKHYVSPDIGDQSDYEGELENYFSYELSPHFTDSHVIFAADTKVVIEGVESFIYQTAAPTTAAPTTDAPTTNAPTTNSPTEEVTPAPTTNSPTATVTPAPTTNAPTVYNTPSPTTDAPTSHTASGTPTTEAPTAAVTPAPTTNAPTEEVTPAPTTNAPTEEVTPAPTTNAPTSNAPTTDAPTTAVFQSGANPMNSFIFASVVSAVFAVFKL